MHLLDNFFPLSLLRHCRYFWCRLNERDSRHSLCSCVPHNRAWNEGDERTPFNVKSVTVYKIYVLCRWHTNTNSSEEKKNKIWHKFRIWIKIQRKISQNSHGWSNVARNNTVVSWNFKISKLNRNWYDEIRIDSLCVCLCVNCAHCALHSIDWYPIPQSNCCCLSGTLNWCSQSNQCSLQPTETTVFGVRHSDRFQSFAHFDDVDNDGTDELLIVH